MNSEIQQIKKIYDILKERGLESRIKTIYDVGLGNVLEIFEFNSFFKNAKVIAFEPNPFNPAKNIDQVYTFAISDKDGEAVFYAGSSDTLLQGSLYKPKSNAKHVGKTPFQKIVIETKRLDTFIKKNPPHPDLLWIDTQGSEFNVLKGLGKYLDNLICIGLELFHQEEYENTPLFDEVDFFLKEKFTLVSGNPFEGIFDNFIYLKKGLT